MTVVVVNCSNWHTFPSLVRTRALDLYRPAEGVEFWHAAPAAYESDLRIWGGWPKCFGEPLWLLRDELWDLVSSHITTVAETMDEAPVDPLTIIVVLESGVPTRRGNADRAIATVMNAMNTIAVRIANERQEDATRVMRSLWRIAVLRHVDGPGSRSLSQDRATAMAWPLVTPHMRANSVDQEPETTGPVETFDTAVLLEGGALGSSDDGSFASLRMLIDMARDQRVRSVLKPGSARPAQRVIRLAAPRVRDNPSDRILTDLAMLVHDYEPSPVRDEAGDPLLKLVDDLRSKTFLADEHLLSAAAKVAVRKSQSRSESESEIEPDSKIEEVLRRYFRTEPPVLAQLAEDGEIERAGELLGAARAKLEPFLRDRHHDLQAMRRAHDGNIRSYGHYLEDVETAATDRSFGQSGHVLSAIENGLEKLRPLQQEYIARAEDCRQRLNDEYRVQLETARSERRDEPLLSDFAEVEAFDRGASRLKYWVANSTKAWQFILGWCVIVGFYAVALAVVIAIGRHGPPWTTSSVWFAASALLPALVSAIWLFGQWTWVHKQRTQALTTAKTTYESAVEHIDRVTRLALAHLASSRVAGRLEPFNRALSYRARDLLDLRTATTRVFDVIRADSKRVAKAASSERTSRNHALDSKLKTADTQDSLKVVLTEIAAAQPADTEITFSGGEMTSGLAVRTALRLDAPLVLSFVLPSPAKTAAAGATPAPAAPARSANAAAQTDRPPEGPAASAPSGRPPPSDRSPDAGPFVNTPNDARKSKRAKRPRN
jgi:hypothetical protein